MIYPWNQSQIENLKSSLPPNLSVWFDLELNGTSQQIESALIYLNDLDVEIWSNSNHPDEETW
ncbi:hypothetical protein [Microcoleus sp. PH2017_01_SCD_O_A]|uniref:hypothetical protein n=1 Tax=Microcoleus sp. PH2017_01_SCD_O_A TaxID=2798812 RepID=UPI00343450E6